jgi:hypothetical protein
MRGLIVFFVFPAAAAAVFGAAGRVSKCSYSTTYHAFPAEVTRQPNRSHRSAIRYARL